jgi:hypothetical protein
MIEDGPMDWFTAMERSKWMAREVAITAPTAWEADPVPIGNHVAARIIWQPPYHKRRRFFTIITDKDGDYLATSQRFSFAHRNIRTALAGLIRQMKGGKMKSPKCTWKTIDEEEATQMMAVEALLLMAPILDEIMP